MLTRLIAPASLALALAAAEAPIGAPAVAAPAATLATAPRGKATVSRPKSAKNAKGAKGAKGAKRASTSKKAAKPAKSAAKSTAKSTKAAKSTTARAAKGAKSSTASRRVKSRSVVAALSARGARLRAERTARSVAARTPAAPAIGEAPPTFTLPDLAVLLPGASPGAPAAVAAAPSVGNRPFTALGRSAAALLDGMISRARGQLGTRYVLGGATPGQGLDCSSFARYAMEAIGIKLPRTAAQQARVGTPVPRDERMLRPGDLLTFGSPRTVSHVGIYLGEGRFIHASVSSGRVIETTFARNGSLLRRWQGARRLIASGDSGEARGG